jgi:hypothetical protein
VTFGVACADDVCTSNGEMFKPGALKAKVIDTIRPTARCIVDAPLESWFTVCYQPVDVVTSAPLGHGILTVLYCPGNFDSSILFTRKSQVLGEQRVSCAAGLKLPEGDMYLRFPFNDLIL